MMSTHFKELISEHIWDTKYRYRYRDKIIDKNLEATWRRVAFAVAQAEKLENRAHWEKIFYEVLSDFQFLPGGRILAGAGTRHQVTLFNCFVMPVKEDSLSAIFNAIKEGALTLQQGGGVGYDFSILRPSGTTVKKTDATASGPVSFMRIWDAMCATMLSTGARRGAMMGILRCDHPDIETFIAAKSDPNELRHFNVSVLVTDAFIQAVKEDRNWELVFPAEKNVLDHQNIIYRHWSHSAEKIPCRIVRTVRARDLWQRIMQSAYDYAEPGVLFEDTINRMNNLWYNEWISATNPCGEIPLPAYGACNLGSLNLTQFVIHPFSPKAVLDWKKLEAISRIATRFLDNVIDVSRYPLKPQQQQAFASRRIGLGITGLADIFVMMGVRYGSEESLQLASRIMRLISHTTWQTSIELAQEKGVFSLLQIEKYLQGQFVQQLPHEIQQDIKKYGVRNSHHNTIAPTGTISLLANNISNGLEPIFSPHYKRNVRSIEGEFLEYDVTDFAYREWKQLNSESALPMAWVDVQSLLPQDHLQIQRAVQPYIDNAISKTINLPRDFPFAKLSDVYMQAHEYRLKGCTIFRPNPVTGSVLSVSSTDDDVDKCCNI
jgi:ribonucleoside-diphosphate reductase alpha chain